MTNIPKGLCQCKCGNRTTIATRNYYKSGVLKGQYQKYCEGHGVRRVDWAFTVKECGYHSPCWVWLRAKSKQGYAYARVKGRDTRIHRYLWEKIFGPTHRNMRVDHLCRNTACIRPDHMEAVTNAVNVQRGNAATLDQEAVIAMRALRATGKPFSAIAARFGVSQPTAWRACSGITWANVPMENSE